MVSTDLLAGFAELADSFLWLHAVMISLEALYPFTFSVVEYIFCFFRSGQLAVKVRPFFACFLHTRKALLIVIFAISITSALFLLRLFDRPSPCICEAAAWRWSNGDPGVGFVRGVGAELMAWTCTLLRDRPLGFSDIEACVVCFS